MPLIPIMVSVVVMVTRLYDFSLQISTFERFGPFVRSHLLPSQGAQVVPLIPRKLVGAPPWGDTLKGLRESLGNFAARNF